MYTYTHTLTRIDQQTFYKHMPAHYAYVQKTRTMHTCTHTEFSYVDQGFILKNFQLDEFLFRRVYI